MEPDLEDLVELLLAGDALRVGDRFYLGSHCGIVVGILGKPELGPRLGGALGYLVQIPVSMVVLRMVLRKRYKRFSIRLVPHE